MSHGVMASLSKPDPGIVIDKMQKAGILAMPFGNMVKCQIQDHQVIQGQVVSVWKKQIGPGNVVRGAGGLSQFPVDFASVHSASTTPTLLATACPGGKVHGTKSLGSLSCSAILKLKTIKIKVRENPSCLRNISIREQIPRAMNFSFYLLFTGRHV